MLREHALNRRVHIASRASSTSLRRACGLLVEELEWPDVVQPPGV
jgi:hypothetical protein